MTIKEAFDTREEAFLGDGVSIDEIKSLEITSSLEEIIKKRNEKL